MAARRAPLLYLVLMSPESDKRPVLSLVAPVYNERDNIVPFLEDVAAVLDAITLENGYEVILVNDGSRDGSDAVLDECAAARPGIVTVVHLARNFGMEPAIQAGLEYARGDAIVVMDSDHQDDPGAIATFLEKWRDGYEVVYAVRTKREEGRLHRFFFWSFYRLLGWLANIELPSDASNFALIDRRVADVLRAMPERNRFLRGLRAWVGFRQAGVPVARRARRAHKTRLGFRGQWKLAMNAIFSFSYVPLFVFRLAGMAALVLSAVLILWALYHKLIAGLALKAWASQLITTAFLGGINLLGIGVVGEYVARIYDEVRRRPNFVIHHVTRRELGSSGE